MKNDKDKEFDDLFKKGLENPGYNSGHMEEDWNDLEKMLDKSKKSQGIVFWLPVLSSVAALLLFIGWYFFKSEVAHDHLQKQEQAVVITPKQKNRSLTNATIITKRERVQANPGTVLRNTQPIKAKEQPVNYAKASPINSHSINNKPALFIPGNNGLYNTSVQNEKVGYDKADTETLAAANPALIIDRASDNKYIYPNNLLTKDIVGHSYTASLLLKQDKVETRAGFLIHPQYALTFIGGSELNGVSSLQQSKSGTNLGLLFSAGVFKKLTISTGANYSTKPYSTSFANYHTQAYFSTTPLNVNADCRVLDIPLNVDYQLYSKHQNKISIGSGLSSYIMLHESYQFNYADPGTQGPTNFNVQQTNKYFFGVLNLQATYQRQINSKVGVSIQPYMKVPLTGIGASQVKLQTEGVALGLSWNLNSLSKP
jgi:hypothetical protein